VSLGYLFYCWKIKNRNVTYLGWDRSYFHLDPLKPSPSERALNSLSRHICIIFLGRILVLQSVSSNTVKTNLYWRSCWASTARNRSKSVKFLDQNKSLYNFLNNYTTEMIKYFLEMFFSEEADCIECVMQWTSYYHSSAKTNYHDWLFLP
jgi:hypothetical protein